MHLWTNDKTATKTGGTVAICLLSALLSLVLITSSLPLIATERAQAATSSTVPDSITFYRQTVRVSTVSPTTATYIYWTEDGATAYCADLTTIGPDEENGTLFYNGWYWASSGLSAVVYNGYPYTTTINGTDWGVDIAQLITQQAVYMYLGQINTDGSYSYTHTTVGYREGNLSNFLSAEQIAAVQYLVDGAKNGTLTAPTNVVAVYYPVTRSVGGTDITTQSMIYCLPAGTSALQKESSNTDLTSGNALYSLEGAVYSIYSSYSDAQNGAGAVATMTTDASGYAETSVGLVEGTYYVKETTAPTGYALDTTIYTVTVAVGSTASVNGGTLYDTPQSDPADVLLQKIDGETGSAQGGASLEGAEYVVEYYDGYYDTAEEARASGKATRTWVFATNKNGFVYLDEGYLISSTSDGSITSDSLYYDSNGDATIPLGTVVIYEYTAPAGYLVSDEIYVTQVTSNGVAEAVSTYKAPTGDTALQEQVIRGGVEIYKTDAETDLGNPQGSASLDGTSFEVITLNVNDVAVDGVTYSYGEVVATLVIEDGYAATSDDLLPYGTYSIQEVSAGTGYLLDDAVYTFTIDMDGEIVTAGEADGHIHDQIIRGDLEFTKKDQASGTAMAGIPFRITSETTGESHIIVTDQNGYVSTASSWNSHSYNTNGNDAAGDGSYDASYGVWFGDASAVDDSLGALPYDTYTIEELACEANEGRQLVVQTGVVIARNNMTVNLGTIDDPTAAIMSEAVDSTDGDHTVVAGVSASITDYVYYYNVVPNREYTLEGALVLTDTGEEFTLDGSAVTTRTTFTPTSTTGVVAVVFDLSETVSALPGDELNVAITVFEKLYYDERLIASHEDVDDTLQQIQIVTPELTTRAFDADDEDQYVEIGEINIKDVLAYTNLEAGAEYYVVSAAFLYENAQDIDPSDLSSALGAAETSFIASNTGDGTVEVLFLTDASELGNGDRIVLFEWIYDAAGNLVAQHVDADDEAQTLIVQTGTYGKTGANFTSVFVGILALTVVGIITTAYGIRRQRTSARRIARKASRSGYRVFDPFLYESPNKDRYQRDI